MLKIGRHVLRDSSNVRTKGSCSASLRRAEYLRDAEQNPSLRTLELSQETCLPILSLKLELDIFEKPESRVQILTFPHKNSHKNSHKNIHENSQQATAFLLRQQIVNKM